MKYNEINKDELYIKLKNEIDSTEGKFILLNSLLTAIEAINLDMPAFLQSPEGQAAFYSAVMRLVSDRIISPVGKKPNASNGLHLKYRISSGEKKDNVLIAQIIKSIEPPAALDYYIKNPNDFLNDSAAVEVISDFIKQKNKEIVTVNERAYELFGDEKFFKGDEKSRSHGEIVLRRLGLGYSSINCEETPEPFFSFQKKDFFLRESRNIYIIENKDTFWSFKKQTMEIPSNLAPDMLIYGEGKKIISSFKFVDEYDIDPEQDVFHYFGDLDAEGVNIYCELKDKYLPYKIVPFYEGYQAILEIGLKKEPVKTPKQQKKNEKNTIRFMNEFDQTLGLKIKKLLDEGFYIPQEALSAIKIKERFGTASHD